MMSYSLWLRQQAYDNDGGQNELGKKLNRSSSAIVELYTGMREKDVKQLLRNFHGMEPEQCFEILREGCEHPNYKQALATLNLQISTERVTRTRNAIVEIMKEMTIEITEMLGNNAVDVDTFFTGLRKTLRHHDTGQLIGKEMDDATLFAIFLMGQVGFAINPESGEKHMTLLKSVFQRLEIL